MNLSSTNSTQKPLAETFSKIKPRPGMAFGVIILTALVAFEIFNYSTTDYALRDLLGDLRFAGVHWATILSLAFCGIDFAGIARLFTPEQGDQEPKEVWYMFGAWLLAATMNAVLTWWGISMAISNHSIASRAMIDAKTITGIVPVFVALMIWIIRILLIGSISSAGERIFSDGKRRNTSSQQPSRGIRSGLPASTQSASSPTMASRAVPRPGFSNDRSAPRPEPSYHSMNARPAGRGTSSGSNESNSSTYQL